MQPEEVWCPYHGRQCNPTVDGCGKERVFFYVLCECPSRGHFHDCEAYLWQEEGTAKATVPEPPAPPVERKRKREKIGYVQLPLKL